MRHVLGLFLAAILAAVMFAGAGWGTWRIEVLQAAGTRLTSSAGLVALAALVGTGLLLGLLLVAPRVSPLAPGLPGLALLGWSAWRVVRPAQAVQFIPLAGSHLAAGWRTLLAGGVILALLGVVMIVPLFVPSRWRRRRRADDDYGYLSDFGLLQ